MAADTDFDVIVIGAGFAGLHQLHRLRRDGWRVLVLEKAPAVGGTWYWNRYPGARCDIESFDYQFSFSSELLDEWKWSERYAAGPEILAYLEFAAERLDLKRDIHLNTIVVSTAYDESQNSWAVTTDDGRMLHATFVVMGVGNLSAIKQPDIPGLGDFGGQWFHTAAWPPDPVDLTGKRVAVIGTGSSGIQTITTIAPAVSRLYVLQRTPNYSMPAQNHVVSEQEWLEVMSGWPERRRLCEWSDAGTPLPPATRAAVDVSSADRDAEYEAGWQRGGISALSGAFTDMFVSEESNAYAQEFARRKIREIVTDPEVADRLSPRHHIGTRRTCVDTGYFETFNRANVELVDLLSEPISRITPQGIELAGRELVVDVIIFAIGFDAITGALDQIRITGRGGLELKQKWAEGPVSLLGLQTADFPNLFFITGPGSPSVLSNMVVSIEQHVDWIADALSYLRSSGFACIEATPSAEAAWMEHVTALVNATLYPRADSWYLGMNIPGKPQVFTVYVAGCGPYRSECEQVVAAGYRGFSLTNPLEPREARTNEQ